MTDIKRIAEKTKQLLTDAGAQKAQYTVTEKEKHEFNVDGGEFSLFRTLSHDIDKRRRENAKFMRAAGPVLSWLRLYQIRGIRRCGRSL